MWRCDLPRPTCRPEQAVTGNIVELAGFPSAIGMPHILPYRQSSRHFEVALGVIVEGFQTRFSSRRPARYDPQRLRDHGNPSIGPACRASLSDVERVGAVASSSRARRIPPDTGHVDRRRAHSAFHDRAYHDPHADRADVRALRSFRRHLHRHLLRTRARERPTYGGA